MLENQVKSLHQKIQLLIKQQSGMLKEHDRLKAENQVNKKTIEAQQAVIAQLQQQVELLKIGTGNWNEQDKKNFEKRINSYIKEIDKCINLLSQ